MLQALAEWGITPAATVGCSGGGIIAGALGAGVPLDALVATWRIVCARPERYGLAEALAFVMNILELSSAPGMFTLRPALEDLVLHARASAVGEWQPGYAVVTTDVSTGEPVVLDAPGTDGIDMSTVDALQATSAFPGLFAGVRIGDALYQDGGLLDNVPANVAARLGAERLLVMSFGGPLGPLAAKVTAWEALYRSVDVSVRAAQAPPPNMPMLKVRPELPAGAWLLSFSLFEQLRQAGYQATVARRKYIEALAGGANDWSGAA